MKKVGENGHNGTTVDFIRRNNREIIIRTNREDGEIVETIARVVPPEKKSNGQVHLQDDR